MPEALPTFLYHPDPLATGSILPSEAECVCCSRARGFVYGGPVYAEADVSRVSLCPWCIADGRAAERFDAMFTDLDGSEPISDEAAALISRRTPGFSAWQQERWLVHCGDGAMFLGPVGAAELVGNEAALDILRAQMAEGRWSAEQVEGYLSALDRDGQPTAYLFSCRHCGAYSTYSDST